MHRLSANAPGPYTYIRTYVGITYLVTLKSVVLFMGYRRFPRPLPNGGRLTVNGDTRYAIGFGIPLCLRTYVRTYFTYVLIYVCTYLRSSLLLTYVRTYVHTYRSVFRGLYLLGSVKTQQASSKQQPADRRYVRTYVRRRYAIKKAASSKQPICDTYVGDMYVRTYVRTYLGDQR